MKNIDRSIYDKKLDDNITLFRQILPNISDPLDKIELRKILLPQYLDPDKYTEWTIDEIRYGADGICGLKYWIEYYNQPFSDDWINAYYTMRSKMLIWPRHVQSINQRRMACYKDRLDFALWDLEKCWVGNESRIVRKNTETETWVSKWKEKNFSYFLEELGLEQFLNQEGKVINLGTTEMRSFQETDIFELDAKSYCDYLNNLIQILS